MPSTIHLVLRSANKACPRLELGARLEARTTSMQVPARCFQQFFHTLFRGGDEYHVDIARPILRQTLS
jgi:hypothetical protein